MSKKQQTPRNQIFKKIIQEKQLATSLWKKLTVLFSWKEFYDLSEKADGAKLFEHERYANSRKIKPQIVAAQEEHAACKERIKSLEAQLS